MAKGSIEWAGFDKLTERINALGGNVEQAAEEALTRSHQYVTTGIAKEMQKHQINGKPVNWGHTGKTKDALIKKPEIEWKNGVASTEVGFSDPPGAAPYLIRGTPRLKPSRGLYNAIYGKKIKIKVQEIHEEAIEDYLATIMSR